MNSEVRNWLTSEVLPTWDSPIRQTRNLEEETILLLKSQSCLASFQFWYVENRLPSNWYPTWDSESLRFHLSPGRWGQGWHVPRWHVSPSGTSSDPAWATWRTPCCSQLGTRICHEDDVSINRNMVERLIWERVNTEHYF